MVTSSDEVSAKKSNLLTLLSLQYFCGDIIAYLHCMSCLILLLTILLGLTSSFWSTDKPDACPVAIYHWLG